MKQSERKKTLYASRALIVSRAHRQYNRDDVNSAVCDVESKMLGLLRKYCKQLTHPSFRMGEHTVHVHQSSTAQPLI